MIDQELSKNRRKELQLLKQKKHRLEKGLVIVEGKRTLQQLKDYGFLPVEQYLTNAAEPLWANVQTYRVKDWELEQLCESEHPQNIAAMFSLPEERQGEFNRGFYLDEICDPGNLGTIFRIAAAFNIRAVLLSPGCAEVSSPKVIRASLGSVFQVPFQILDITQLSALNIAIYATQTATGIAITEFHPHPEDKIIIALGSEAHGLSPEIMGNCKDTLRIQMASGMESLNVAVAAGIIAHHLYS